MGLKTYKEGDRPSQIGTVEVSSDLIVIRQVSAAAVRAVLADLLAEIADNLANRKIHESEMTGDQAYRWALDSVADAFKSIRSRA